MTISASKLKHKTLLISIPQQNCLTPANKYILVYHLILQLIT